MSLSLRHQGQGQHPDGRRLLAHVLVSAALIAGAGGWTGKAYAAEVGWPRHVKAKYEISFAGVDIGWFVFESKIAGPDYHLTGRGKVSALFGAFRWSGTSTSAGSVQGITSEPGRYVFDYKANKRKRRIALVFRDRRVAERVLTPNRRPSRKAVPLQRQHLVDVMDPLTAVMALTRFDGERPCQKRLAIFDGKARFDLVLIAADRKTDRSSGRMADHVCGVRYVPIAGHKPSRGTKFMASTRDIRIWMRPVAQGGIYVPYEIRLPTIAGDAVMRARSTEIITAQDKRIALRH